MIFTMTKDEIRAEIRRKLATFSDSREKFLRGLKLAEKILPLLAGYPEGACIAAYMSIRNELPTDSLIRILRIAGFKVAIPAWCAEDSCYRFSLYPALIDLIRGPMGIKEPRSPKWVAPEEISLIIVPGLAFSPDGHRLGHGGGWYDRLLAARPASSRLVGVGYDFQILDESIPLEPHDIILDEIVGV